MAYQLSKEAKVNFVPLKNFLDKIILNLQQTVILREFAKSKTRYRNLVITSPACIFYLQNQVQLVIGRGFYWKSIV